MNENKIRVYDSTGATPIYDPDGLLDHIEQIKFSTVYPGGRYDVFTAFVPCDVTRYIPIQWMQRITVRNGLTTVWEGAIINISPRIDAAQGIEIEAVGYWQQCDTRYRYARWIDRRYQSNIFGVWAPTIFTTGGYPKANFDQNLQLGITPKSVDWANGDVAYYTYITNASPNVKRIVFDYDFGTKAETLPVRAKKYTAIGATYSGNLGNMIDGNATTSQNVSLAIGDYLYIGLKDPASVTGFRFDFGGTVNANAAVLTCEYYGVDGLWHLITITDGTSSGGKTWAQDGSVTFTEIDGCDQTTINGSQKFFYFRFAALAALTANVTINDVFAVCAQSWTMFFYDARNSAYIYQTTTAGTGSQDITLATSTDWITFALRSEAAQKPIGNGVYAKITNLALVAESWDNVANTTVQSILKNMVHYLAFLADDYTYIGANTYDMLAIGFAEDDLKNSVAKQMIKLGTFSATNTAYSVGVIASDAIGGGNIKPVAYYEAYPDLTDYDYGIRLDEQQLQGLQLVESANFQDLYNNVYVLHTDSTGKTQWANSADDPLLDDAASDAKYSLRTHVIQGGQSATLAGAGVFGRPYVAQHKNLQFYMRSPLLVMGTIRRKDGTLVPVSQVHAGQRLRIENFINDVGDVGSGLTFLISRTDYDDATNTISITAGVPDNLAIYLARQAVMGKQLMI